MNEMYLVTRDVYYFGDHNYMALGVFDSEEKAVDFARRAALKHGSPEVGHRGFTVKIEDFHRFDWIIRKVRVNPEEEI